MTLQSPFTPMILLGTVLGAWVLGIVLTYAVRQLANRFGIIDEPKGGRKIHTTPVALAGGAAVILTFTLAVAAWSPWLLGGYLLPKHLIGVCAAACALLIGGVLDDAYDLRPQYQIAFPVLAALLVIASGIGVDYITNPFGGVLQLDQWNISLFTWQGQPYGITVWADLFAFVWLMLTMYTTKFLDGLDGLVSGVSVIGLTVIAALSFTQIVMQPETGVLALLAAAAFAGFLVWNWNPATIFLGESGSLFAGFILGTLAIISGGKIATALLILGIPLLDVIWVVFRRLFIEKRSPFQADRKHLHLRLIDAGLTQKQAVFVLYVVTALFGASSLYLQAAQKLNALAALVAIMIIFAAIVVRMYRGRPLDR